MRDPKGSDFHQQTAEKQWSFSWKNNFLRSPLGSSFSARFYWIITIKSLLWRGEWVSATLWLLKGQTLDLGVKLRITETTKRFYFFLCGKPHCQLQENLKEPGFCSVGQGRIRWFLWLCPSSAPQVSSQSISLLAESSTHRTLHWGTLSSLLRCLLNLQDAKTTSLELMCSSYCN